MYDEDDTLTGVFVEMRGAYEVAKKYGMGNLVATIDATHETNAFGFKLVDVVVTDHNNIIRCMAVAVIKTENVEAFRFVLKGANPKDKKSGLDKALDMIERLRKNQKKFVG